MGAFFQILRQKAVDAFAADDDPNVTDPDVDPAHPKSVVLGVRPLDAELAAVGTLAAHAGFDPKTPAATVSYTLYYKDESVGTWLLIDAHANAPLAEEKRFKVVPGARVFARMTALGGAPPAGGQAFVRGLAIP